MSDETKLKNKADIESLLENLVEVLRTVDRYKSQHPLCAEIANLIVKLSMGIK